MITFFLLPFPILTFASSIDAKFKMQKKVFSKGIYTESTRSNSIHFLYKDVLGKSMYSECTWLPSDSEFMAIKSSQCGIAKGTLLAVGRFMNESDASRLSLKTVRDQGRLRFIDFGGNCDFF